MKVSSSSPSLTTKKIHSPAVATSNINDQSNEIQRTHLHKVCSLSKKPNSRLQAAQKGMRSPGSDSLRDVTKIGSFDYHGAVSRYDLPADVIDQVEDEFDVICEQFDLEDELTTLAAELPQAPTETLFDFPAVPKNPIKDSLAETLSSLGNSKRRLKEESFNNGLSSFTDSSARQLARKIAVDFERANPHQQSASSINANTPPKSRALLQLEKKVSELRRQFEQKEREVEALELKISDCPSQSKEYKLLMHKLAKVGAQFDQTEKRLQKAIQQLSLSR